MSLTIQLNINYPLAFDQYTELDPPTAGGSVTKSVDAQGVVIIDAAATEVFGAFDPGSVLGSRSGDFVLQTMQVSSATGMFSAGDVALIGPKPPGVAGDPHRFVFHTLTAADDLFVGGQIIPAGYKLSFNTDATGTHVIRLTMWPISRLEQISALLAI
jgi:hypothetical protein